MSRRGQGFPIKYDGAPHNQFAKFEATQPAILLNYKF